tara:strand:- start:3823 stop:4155 length:333 start_codon:yes stop_codon:yes gene_type:complete
MSCNCNCHKKNAQSELKKCKEQKKQKSKELSELKKKMLALTIALAVIGTLVGKETLDRVVEYFETLDKVKQSSENLFGEADPNFISVPYPSPSTLAVFACLALVPTKRRT